MEAVRFIQQELFHYLVDTIKQNVQILFVSRELYMLYTLTGIFIVGIILSIYCMVNLASYAGRAIEFANRKWKFAIRCFPVLFVFNSLFEEEGKGFQVKTMKWLVFTILSFVMTFTVGYYRASFM